jgi:DNA-binding transcriptional MocR family regulator
MKKIDLSTALQYGQAQGYPALLSWVRQFTLENLHPDVPYHGGPDVAMTCGSTDGFAKTLQIFVEPWSEEYHPVSERPGLLCETFVYGSILTQSLPLGMQVVPVRADAGGMVVKGPGGLEDVLGNWDVSKGKRPHLMYTVT